MGAHALPCALDGGSARAMLLQIWTLAANQPHSLCDRDLARHSLRRSRSRRPLADSTGQEARAISLLVVQGTPSMFAKPKRSAFVSCLRDFRAGEAVPYWRHRACLRCTPPPRVPLRGGDVHWHWAGWWPVGQLRHPIANARPLPPSAGALCLVTSGILSPHRRTA